MRELEAGLAAVAAERAALLERQRSGGKPPRAPATSPRAAQPGSPGGRSGQAAPESQLAAAQLQIASLQAQVSHTHPCSLCNGRVTPPTPGLH